MKHPLVLLASALILLSGAGVVNAIGDKVQVILIIKEPEDTCATTGACVHYCALEDSACVSAIAHCSVLQYTAYGWPTCAVYFALKYGANNMFQVQTP